jgi:hypothetical protein
MKVYLSSPSVASVFQQVSFFCCWQPSLSAQGEDENESDEECTLHEEYTHVPVDDSALEFDTPVGLSIATKTGTMFHHQQG